MAKRTAAGIQADIAKGAFRPHTALSNVALAYYQSDANSFAKTVFPICPVTLSSDNYYIFDKEDLLRDNWHRKPAYGKVDPAVLSEHTDTYACVVDQMIMGIDQIRQTDLNRRMGPRTADPKQQRTKTMAGQLNIHQDSMFARKFFRKGVWTQEYTGIDSTTPASGQFIKFSNGNSDPVSFVDDKSTEMEEKRAQTEQACIRCSCVQCAEKAPGDSGKGKIRRLYSQSGIRHIECAAAAFRNRQDHGTEVHHE